MVNLMLDLLMAMRSFVSFGPTQSGGASGVSACLDSFTMETTLSSTVPGKSG